MLFLCFLFEIKVYINPAQSELKLGMTRLTVINGSLGMFCLPHALVKCPG